MSQQTLPVESSTLQVLTLNVQSVGLTDEQFELLCRDNRDLRIELTAKGELILMPPTGAKTGWRNSTLIFLIVDWARNDGTGLCFDSSTVFTLLNGAKRSPDVAWIKRERWETLTEKEQEIFAPICPDFVIELRSPSDSLFTLQEKMPEYLDNGSRLGWLIDPIDKRVYVYRPQRPIECLENPEAVSGDPVLPKFVFEAREIW